MTEIFNYIYKKVNIINKDLIHILLNQITNENKFFLVDLLVLKNKFLTNDIKDEFIREFSKIQNVYHKLSKFVYLYKFKKAKIYEYDHDFTFTPLNEYKTNMIFTLFENNIKYKFKITDLIHIIKSSLINCVDMFVSTNTIKNPHTNNKILNSNIYNIYFFILNNKLAMPKLFYLFFQDNLNIKKFEHNNEVMIVDEYIKHTITNMQRRKQIKLCKELIYSCRGKIRLLNRIKIHPNYSEDIILEKLKHLIPNYLYQKYSLNPTKQHFHNYILIKKLKDFIILNPMFGRVIRKKEFITKTEDININFIKKNETFIFGDNTETISDQSTEISNTVSIRNRPNVARRLSFINNTEYYDTVDNSNNELMITGVGYISGIQAFVSSYINNDTNYIESDYDDDDEDDDMLNYDYDSDETIDSL